MLSAAVRRFLPLLEEVAKDFSGMLQARVEREGRGEEGRRSLTIDPSPDLFRFALEGQGASSSRFALLAEILIKAIKVKTSQGCILVQLA